MPLRPEKIKAIRQLMNELGIDEKDLKEEFIIGSGKGGQKLQKTRSCVCLKHLPTGIVVKCHADRQRETNRLLARRILCEKIEERKGCGKKHLIIEKIRKQKSKRRRRSINKRDLEP